MEAITALAFVPQESAQRHWGKFFGQLQNSDMKHKFLKQCGSALNSGYNYLLQDESKLMFANVFLLTQGLPTIQPNNVVDSVLALVDKSIKARKSTFEFGGDFF